MNGEPLTTTRSEFAVRRSRGLFLTQPRGTTRQCRELRTGYAPLPYGAHFRRLACANLFWS
jgi:hypothetical protein